MDKSGMDPFQMRDKGMSYIMKGKEFFNGGKTANEKEQGYNVYRKGLEMIMTYLKSKHYIYRAADLHSLGENNAEIRNMVKENMKQWILDGQKMASQIDHDRGPVNNSRAPNTNNNSNNNDYNGNASMPQPSSQGLSNNQSNDNMRGSRSDIGSKPEYEPL